MAQRTMSWATLSGSDGPVTGVLSTRPGGKVRYFMGRYVEAEKNLLESIAIVTYIHGSELPDVGESKAELSFVLEKLGRLDEAEDVLRDGLQIPEATLGADHPDVSRYLPSTT